MAHFAKSPIRLLDLRHTDDPACTRKCLGGQRESEHPAKRPWRSCATNSRRARWHGGQRALDLRGWVNDTPARLGQGEERG